VTVHDIAYVEFHVADADKTAVGLATDYGFALRHLPGPERPGTTARLAVQGSVRLVLVSAADPEHPVAESVRRHGDAVAALALHCADPAAVRAAALAAGAVDEPERGLVGGFGELALRPVGDDDPVLGLSGPVGLLRSLDHVAICVPGGELAGTVDYAGRALGLREIFGEYIEVGAQAMDSKVVQSASGGVTFTLLEPDLGREPGQIDAFLAAHGGTGVQHLAFETGDIARAVREAAERGVEFLSTPGAYYEQLAERVADCAIPVETLRELHVLVDEDHGGQLFQIFARSTHPRRTFFLELIERRGAGTFGTANIKALYEAVERQRAAAGDH
jgi:4-hydroxymandelate synthase